ncbi:MAG: SPFH domain-containing protein [Planctomycetota bacterium]
MVQKRTEEIARTPVSGFLMLFVALLFLAGTVASIVRATQLQTGWYAIPAGACFILLILTLCGFVVVNPNQSKVLVLFGKYTGSIVRFGFYWVNPFTMRTSISLRIRNFTSDKLKVNDRRGNPIDIAAVVVWKVANTAEAAFDVDDYQSYVAVQSEAAVRQLAASYPYDTSEHEEISLRGSADDVNKELRQQLTERLELAGIEVLEARLSHLAYAPEIAGAMLQRQQAEAIIAARTRIVEGAVSMVDMALEGLKKRGVVDLDEERKATMVSNLLVVLCSEHAVQPVLNTGSLYT